MGGRGVKITADTNILLRAPQKNPSMPIVNVSEAKTRLSRLLRLVEAEDEVIIARRDQPVAKLVRYRSCGERRFDAMKGKIKITDAFFEPLPEEELKRREGR